jgi:hypothetical protein
MLRVSTNRKAIAQRNVNYSVLRDVPPERLYNMCDLSNFNSFTIDAKTGIK